MQIQLDKDDLVHICEVLRDDLLVSKAILEEHPEDDSVSKSLSKSQKCLMKISATAIMQVYEPNNMATRSRLN